MDLFKSEREEWLNKARRVAEKIAIQKGKVDIEDVLAECPRPKYLHPGITGHVFQNGVFRRMGYKNSRRPISNGRVIWVWSLKAEYYPESVLIPNRPFVREYGDTY